MEATNQSAGSRRSAFISTCQGMCGAAGFKKMLPCKKDRGELERYFVDFIGSNDNAFLEIRVRPGSRADLGRGLRARLRKTKGCLCPTSGRAVNG